MTQVVGHLIEQKTLAEAVRTGETPEWVTKHWFSFREGLTDDLDGEPFPCYFGADSVRDGEPLYTAVPSMTDPDALFALGETLQAYLVCYRDHAERASLVAFFQPPAEPLSEADYHEHLWHILQFLHIHDPEPWPADIPTDPDDTHWEFSFAGEPMFPTCRAPFYADRQSRSSPAGLEITFQPRALFENMEVTADTERGQAAREVIQERLERYDGIPPHPQLGDWGVDGDREWPQYMFAADETQAPDECPITVSREHPKALRLVGE
jgi:hypothetical protein